DPGTPLGGVSREWLGIDSVGDHFGRRLLDEAGVAQLVERGTLTHRDDRPELEFVAARRFLDPVWDSHVFDSLMDLEVRVGGHPGTTPVLLARAMTSPRIPSTQGPILEAAHRAQPDNPVWLVRVARMRFAAGDSAFADSVLPGLVRTRNPEALLFAAALAARRGDQRRRAALLREALARGGDTAEAEAGLAALAQRLLDLSGGGDHVVHVARQGTRLLRGAREVVQRHRHAGRAQAQQVEPHVLHRQHARLQLVRHQLAPGEQVGERLALAVEQA